MLKKMMLVLFLPLAVLVGQDFKYTGSQTCKMCHKSAKKGAQFKKWNEGPHGSAFETLKSEKSLAIAKEKGVQGNPWEAPECLTCHVTGYGSGGYEVMDAAFWDQKTEKGKPIKAVKRMAGLQAVGCESCHGPGSKYKKKKTMKSVRNGEIDYASVGLWEANEETCKKCHNESSPTYVPFVFEERVKEIMHPIPPQEKK